MGKIARNAGSSTIATKRTLDGRSIEAKGVELLIDLLIRRGTKVPSVCYHHQLGPIQTCDTCLIEVNGELVRACATRLADEMNIETKSARAVAQGGALVFQLPVARDRPNSPNGIGPYSSELEAKDKLEPEYFTEAEIRRLERENILAILRKTAWKIKGIDGAAEFLGIKPTTLVSLHGKARLKRRRESRIAQARSSDLSAK